MFNNPATQPLSPQKQVVQNFQPPPRPSTPMVHHQPSPDGAESNHMKAAASLRIYHVSRRLEHHSLTPHVMCSGRTLQNGADAAALPMVHLQPPLDGAESTRMKAVTSLSIYHDGATASARPCALRLPPCSLPQCPSKPCLANTNAQPPLHPLRRFPTTRNPTDFVRGADAAPLLIFYFFTFILCIHH